MAAARHRIPAWSWAAPLVAFGLLLAPATGWVLAPIGLALAVTVFAAVHHAEIVAHRLGEPFGTLVLALAVTVIEVALIFSLMLAPGAEKPTLARDTVFAAVMIVGNGIVGLCLLVGGARHREQGYNLSGTAALLAVLVALATLTLMLPAHTTTIAGPSYNSAQLVFVAVVSLLLYGTFLFVQTIRHRDYFLPAEPLPGEEREEVHADPPPASMAATSFGLLLPCLVAVVLLAKAISPAVQGAVADAGAPLATVGVVIALLVLLPEGLAALNAARQDRLQTALNLALGSALCTIGLTIPAVAALCLAMELPLVLGLAAKDQVLLVLTVALSILTLGTTGRTTVLQGVVHLVVFATFLFLTVVP